MESLDIIDNFFSGPLAIFPNMACIFMQVIGNAKQSFADFLQNRCSEKFRKFHRKTPILESLLNKVGLKAWNFIKKRLQHRCFLKFLKTPFLQNTSGGCFWKW